MNEPIITSDPIGSSRAIWEQALKTHGEPYAKVLALSGGNDSRAAYYAAKELGIEIDYILHVRTGTGIQETTDWVRWFATEHAEIPYIEADAGDTYERWVLEHGFFGLGREAHAMTFHLLKRDQYVSALSREIRQRKRNRKIFLINGARIAESENRRKNLNQPVRPDKRGSNNIWVNLCHYWEKQHCVDVCEDNHAPQNPVARELCRSGECLCGSYQPKEDRIEAATLYPEWGAWLDDLERRVQEKFPWGWGDRIPKSWSAEKAGQLSLFTADHQPMCSTCLKNAPIIETTTTDDN